MKLYGSSVGIRSVLSGTDSGRASMTGKGWVVGAKISISPLDDVIVAQLILTEPCRTDNPKTPFAIKVYPIILISLSDSTG